MTGIFLSFLIPLAAILACAVLLDLQPSWFRADRITNWPFKDMIATNAVIFIGIFFTVLIGLIMLFGTTGLGWI